MLTQPPFICPICRNTLEKTDKSYHCEKSHCFDIAKEGYVNLLPVQQKKSINPGDNRVMIQSRRDFLNKNFFDMLIEPCANIIDKLIKDRFENCCLLDIACGDGYFTTNIYQHLDNSTCFFGMDISKVAVKFSAKNNKNISWFVSSNNDLPLPDNSIDIILKIHSPLNYAKSQYKLSKHGVVISVTPGETHLNGLKKIIYEDATLHEPENCPDNYTAVSSQTISGTLSLNNDIDIKNVFMMTPFFWNASQNNKDKINKLSHLTSDISFNIQVWEKQ